MLERCNPQIVQKAHSEAHSWRKVAQVLNDLYGVSLSFGTWRDYATGEHDIADPATRARLMLPPRSCPTCGNKKAQRNEPTAPKRIRVYGYPVQKLKTFTEVIDLQNAPR